jgi:isoquinoline 1-oxidoreductase beta subunit
MKELALNAWIHISNDNHIKFLIDRSEMGQGVTTSLPMLLAEELEVELSQIQYEFAPADAAYTNPLIGMQLTGGSSSIRAAWMPLRQAGAVARTLLIQTAAQQWKVKESECHAAGGKIIHEASKQEASYGELAEAAAKLPAPAPDMVFLKDPKDFRLIGKPIRRLDSRIKINGSAQFGSDVKLPGMLSATVIRCPVFGGKVKSFNADKAKQVKGVKAVIQISAGIAVVAEHFWAALKGREALEIAWDEGANANLDSAGLSKLQAEALDKGKAAVAANAGDFAAAVANAAKKLEAVYEAPYQAHACMEPMSCTAAVKPDHCDVWVGTQGQTRTQAVAMEITGLKAEAVKVHTLYLGGGFGRRSETDFVRDAVECSKAVGAPVKVLWTRADDMQQSQYRPATYNRLQALLDKDNQLIGWQHRMAGQSIMSRVFPTMVKNGIDPTSVEGAANLPYAIPNFSVEYVMENAGAPVGFWRSVGSSQNAFITECFLDEIAAELKQDPLQLRLALLEKQPRHKKVLELAADKAGWGKPAEGRFQGIAVAESFKGYCAQVAEVSVDKDGNVKVHRVVCAIDCGSVVNPDTVAAQMESAIVYALTATLRSAITLDKGRVAQTDFVDFPLLRYDEMPAIEVHIMPSDQPPGGVGEPGTPPLAPAVANAIFAATGKRVRHLPIRPQDLKLV